jgi:CRISPR-associated endonuclease/helicase Cas3
MAADAIWQKIEADLGMAMEISTGELRGALRPLLLAAALLHDVGKANSAFQKMLASKGPDKERQPLRHEILSAVLLVRRLLVAGLEPMSLWLLVWAVAGHHLKMHVTSDQGLYVSGNTPKFVTLYMSHPEVAQLATAAAAVLQAHDPAVQAMSPPGDRRFETLDDHADSLQGWVETFERDSEKVWRPFAKNTSIQRQLGLLKALLMAADAAGSALPGDGQPINSWISDALKTRVDQATLEPVVQHGHQGKPHDFQNAVAASDRPVTVVIAGCGNGKTTAAYMWAQRWAVGRKLWFTYPTTGTASAGFADYLLKQDAVTSALVHGRALVDLQAMLGTQEDDKLDDWLRLESLQAWNRQVIACTVDTVLGLIQNQRRPLYSFPAIAAGAFVFDEIHSYDKRLFGELLTFLETFPGVPVLLMSASIPPHRLEALQRVLGDRMGKPIEGDHDLEGYKRYSLEKCQNEEACWGKVQEELARDKKVLWVSNTVNAAIALARTNISSLEPIVYHARFRYRDKVERQQELIDAFAYRTEPGKRHLRKQPGATLAITTQICEMSLNVSADLMVTAECPLPSLVQRLGRLNRFAERDDPWPCLVYPFRGLPYNEDEKLIPTHGDYRASMAATRKTLDDLDGIPCSQADLALRLKKMTEREEPDRSSAWLQGGWQTESMPARQGDASITVIRAEDLEDIKKELGTQNWRTWTNKRLVPWTIPMQLGDWVLPALFRKGFSFTDRRGGYPVAPAGTVSYSLKEGATWTLKSRS